MAWGAFVAQLNVLRVDCGNPSLRMMERIAHKAGRRELPRSSIADMLKSKPVGRAAGPALDAVIEFVAVCQEFASKNGITIDPHRTAPETWRLMWKEAKSDVGPHLDDDEVGDDGSALADVRDRLIANQYEAFDRVLDCYRALVDTFSRKTLIRALSQASSVGVISTSGVRVPIWGSSLHYRFVVCGDANTVEVRLERDDTTVLSSRDWKSDEGTDDFLQALVDLVEENGADVGLGLNDPTNSIEDLADMLQQVSRLRAQDANHRRTLARVVERVDGWYFTEDAIYPRERLEYQIQAERLDEIDWVDHLEGKGWNEARFLIPFARRLYGVEAGIPKTLDEISERWKN